MPANRDSKVILTVPVFFCSWSKHTSYAKNLLFASWLDPWTTALWINTNIGKITVNSSGLRCLLSQPSCSSICSTQRLSCSWQGLQPLCACISKTQQFWRVPHSALRYVQVNDYPAPDKIFNLFVPAFPTPDDFNEYLTLYRQAAISEYYIIEKQSTDMAEYIFKLRVIDISHSHKIYYVGFLELPEKGFDYTFSNPDRAFKPLYNRLKAAKIFVFSKSPDKDWPVGQGTASYSQIRIGDSCFCRHVFFCPRLFNDVSVPLIKDSV